MKKSNLKLKLLVWSLVLLILFCLFLLFQGQAVMKATHVDSASIQSNMGGYVSTLIGTVVGAVIAIFGAIATQMLIDADHDRKESATKSAIAEQMLLNDFKCMVLLKQTDLIEETIAKEQNGYALTFIKQHNLLPTREDINVLTYEERLRYLHDIQAADKTKDIQPLIDFYSNPIKFSNDVAEAASDYRVHLSNELSKFSYGTSFINDVLKRLEKINKISSKAFEQYMEHLPMLFDDFVTYIKMEKQLPNGTTETYADLLNNTDDKGMNMDLCFLLEYVNLYNLLIPNWYGVAPSAGFITNVSTRAANDFALFKEEYPHMVLSVHTDPYRIYDIVGNSTFKHEGEKAFYSYPNALQYPNKRRIWQYEFTYKSREHWYSTNAKIQKYIHTHYDGIEKYLQSTDESNLHAKAIEELCQALTDNYSYEIGDNFISEDIAHVFDGYKGDTPEEKIKSYCRDLNYWNFRLDDYPGLYKLTDDSVHCILSKICATERSVSLLTACISEMDSALYLMCDVGPKFKEFIVNLNFLPDIKSIDEISTFAHKERPEIPELMRTPGKFYVDEYPPDTIK